MGMKAELVAIYRSDTNRARDTAAPLAMATGLMPVVYPEDDIDPLVDSTFVDHRGETVFVVGYSNTVPDIIEAAGGPALPDIDMEEFGQPVRADGVPLGRRRVTLLNLQYGAASP